MERYLGCNRSYGPCYLNRVLDPAALMVGVKTELSATWTDYDGDEPYGDFTGVRYVNDTLTETRSFEPGLGTFGWMDDGSGAGTTMPDTSTVAHYHSDLIGTTRRMSDSTGAASPGGGGSPAGSVTYTAFGERISGTPSDRYGYAGAWGYQSHRIDEVDPPLDPAIAFPFLHVGARYYDPATGRFLQRDPIGIEGGLNVYEYVWSSPVSLVDPLGQGVGHWLCDTMAMHFWCPHATGGAKAVLACTGGRRSWLDDKKKVRRVSWWLDKPSWVVAAPVKVFTVVPKAVKWGIWVINGLKIWFF